MNNIILTAQQAAELHSTGRLTGYREKCEWQPNAVGDFTMTKNDRENEYLFEGTFMVGMVGMMVERTFSFVRTLTPPRDTVKEPAMVDWVKTSNQDDSTEGADWIGAFVVYGEPPKDYRQHGEWHDCPAEYADTWNRDVELGNHDELLVYSAETMPDWAIRQHVRITDRKLIIQDGELWWDMDLEKVG